MILDKQLTLSDQQTIAAVASTIVSTNSIALAGTVTDTLGNTIPTDLGRGNVPQLLCQITEAVTSAGAATVQVQLIHSANADLSSPTVLSETAAIAKATLVTGYQFRLAIPVGVTSGYVGLQYVIGTATTTAGKVTAGLVLNKGTQFIG